MSLCWKGFYIGFVLEIYVKRNVTTAIQRNQLTDDLRALLNRDTAVQVEQYAVISGSLATPSTGPALRKLPLGQSEFAATLSQFS